MCINLGMYVGAGLQIHPEEDTRPSQSHVFEMTDVSTSGLCQCEEAKACINLIIYTW